MNFQEKCLSPFIKKTIRNATVIKICEDTLADNQRCMRTKSDNR